MNVLAIELSILNKNNTPSIMQNGCSENGKYQKNTQKCICNKDYYFENCEASSSVYNKYV